MYNIKITETFALVKKDNDLEIIIDFDEMLKFQNSLSDNENQMLLLNYLQSNIKLDVITDSFKLSSLELKMLCRMYDIKIIAFYAKRLLESRARYEKNKSKTVATSI